MKSWRDGQNASDRGTRRFHRREKGGGWIEFEGEGVNERVMGETPYEAVLGERVERVG